MQAIPLDNKTNVRTRIAPSPTGDPHIGTIYQALFDYAYARKFKHNGQFIVRIEDTDQARYVAGAEAKILESIYWLGLKYDEGPDTGGPYFPYRQSERKELYHQYAQELISKKAAFYCFCTPERLTQLREEQQAKKQVPKYDRFCLNLTPAEISSKLKTEKAVIRLLIPEGETTFHDEIRGEIKFNNKDIDDQVLLKSDGFPTYHLAVVVDDYLMKITHVIRGEEWVSSTPKHVILYHAFGWDLPKFAHLPLLRNPDKSKLSKRKNPTSVLWFREQGYLPEAILNFLGLMGFSFPGGREIFTLDEFIEAFSFDKINTTGPIFDYQKLDWLNGAYIRKLSLTELAERLISFNPDFKGLGQGKLLQVLPLVQDRLKKLSDFESLTSFFFSDGVEVDTELLKKTVKKDREQIHQALVQLASNLGQANFANHDHLEQVTRQTAKELGWQDPELFMTTRIAITGQKATPPLFDTMMVLGKEKVLERLTVVARKARMEKR